MTRKTTAWAVSIWQKWRGSRAKRSNDVIPPLLENASNQELNHWMAKFIYEVRNQHGEAYTGSTLYSICSGIQRYIREKRASSSSQNVIDIYKMTEFSYFRMAFDAVLKELHQLGIGTIKKQASIITEDLEDRMWNEGILGSDTPEKLSRTLLYCLGLNLALRSGKEHRNLCPDMFQIFDTKPAYLLYVESGSKNNSGGLRDRTSQLKYLKMLRIQVDAFFTFSKSICLLGLLMPNLQLFICNH